MANSDVKKGALDWARRGVPVFPCSAKKVPLTMNGHLDATTDPVQVEFLFDNTPEDTMVGARMGADSGLFAMDFDTYKPGADQYLQHLSDRGLLNDTQVHTTQSGGIHLLYRGDGEYPNLKPHAGVEVKGEGGYVVVPPSRGYSIEKEGIAYANPELIQELLRAKKASSSSTVDALKQAILSAKSFHDPLAQIAARRSAQGWPPERVQSELLDTLRASTASDPSHPRHSRWSDIIQDKGEELSRIVGSGNTKYNPNTHTEKAKERISAGMQNKFRNSTKGVFTRSEPQGTIGVQDVVPQLGIDKPEDILADWPFGGYQSLEERDVTSQRYTMYPLFAEKETVLLASEPKAGKTAVAVKLCMCVSRGQSMGDLQVTEPRPSLYFTLEGVRAVEMRLQAENRKAKEDGIEPPEKDMMFIVDRPHNFADPDQQVQNCAKIALHNEKCKLEFGSDLGLIVIDTLTKAMPGSDQNSVEDTSQFFEMIGLLRGHGVTATIVFVHHLSKQGNIRGSTNLEAEVDVVATMEKVKALEGHTRLSIRRARSMDESLSYVFKLTSFDLGKTIQGHSLSAPVVTMAGMANDDTSRKAADSMYWKRVNDAIVTLGEGEHKFSDLCYALAVMDPTVEVPSDNKLATMKRPKYQDPISKILAGKRRWLYGNFTIKIRTRDDIIVGVELLDTGE